MGRTSGDVKIHRKNRINPHNGLCMGAEESTRDGAGSHGDDDLGGRGRIIGLSQSTLHVLGHRPCYKETVGMPGGGDKLNPQPPQIPPHGVENIGVRLTGAAPSGADLAKLQGTAEETMDRLLPKGIGVLPLGGDEQGLAPLGGQAELPTEADHPLGARRCANGAKGAQPHIDGGCLLPQVKGIGGTYLNA